MLLYRFGRADGICYIVWSIRFYTDVGSLPIRHICIRNYYISFAQKEITIFYMLWSAFGRSLFPHGCIA